MEKLGKFGKILERHKGDGKVRVLFSAVGDSDPIRGRRDGSMLNIVRKYRPNKVVLFLSERMLGFDEKDNRYLLAIQSISSDIEIIKIPICDVELHDYNAMFDYFHSKMQQYFDSGDYLEKLVNIASGTPQMKMALTLMATFRNDITCIQVDTPKGDSNAGDRHETEANIEQLIETNLDATFDYYDRTKVVEIPTVTHKIQLENIKILVQNYDYSGAVNLIRSANIEVVQEVKNLIRGANFRSILNAQARNFFNNTEFAYRQKEDALQEYLNILQLKLYRNEYADFIRAFTPAIEEVLFLVLEKVGIKKSDFTKQTPSGKRKTSCVLDMEKICNQKTNEHIKTVFCDVVPNKSGISYFYNSHLYALLKLVLKDIVYESAIAPIEKLEKSFRNLAAHEIIMVDEQKITQSTGIRPDEVLAKMASIANVKLGLYNRINKQILGLLA